MSRSWFFFLLLMLLKLSLSFGSVCFGCRGTESSFGLFLFALTAGSGGSIAMLFFWQMIAKNKNKQTLPCQIQPAHAIMISYTRAISHTADGHFLLAINCYKSVLHDMKSRTFRLNQNNIVRWNEEKQLGTPPIFITIVILNIRKFRRCHRHRLQTLKVQKINPFYGFGIPPQKLRGKK